MFGLKKQNSTIMSTKKSTLIPGAATTFDEDHQLFETFVGESAGDMGLLYSSWGNTSEKSKVSAEKLTATINLLIGEKKHIVNS